MSVDIQTHPSNLSANGRFGRLAYLGWNMLMGVVIIGIAILLAILIPNFDQQITNPSPVLIIAMAIIGLVFYIALIYYSFIFTIRRLHDRNQSGWLSLLMLVPLVNFILFIYLSCAKGDAAANNYGAPHLTKTWEKILGWIYIILLPIAMLGLVAAIAIPAYQDYVQRAKQAQIQMQQQQYPE